MPNPYSIAAPRAPNIPDGTINRNSRDPDSSKYPRMATDRRTTQMRRNPQGKRSKFSFWMRKIMQPSRDAPHAIHGSTSTPDNNYSNNSRNGVHERIHDHNRQENNRNNFTQQRHSNDNGTTLRNSNSDLNMMSNALNNDILKPGGSTTVAATNNNTLSIPTKSRSNTTTALPVTEREETPCKVRSGAHVVTQADLVLGPPLLTGQELEVCSASQAAETYYYSDSATINSSLIPNYNAEESDYDDDRGSNINNTGHSNGGGNWNPNNAYTNNSSGNGVILTTSNLNDHISGEERDLGRSSMARRSIYTNRTDQDDASIVPLFSICSSSVKSSIFSDINSLQSTKPTVHTLRTVETTSSIIAIPPASILDRANTTATATSTSQNVTNSPYYVRSSSVDRSLHRWNSSVTVDSIVTLRS